MKKTLAASLISLILVALLPVGCQMHYAEGPTASAAAGDIPIGTQVTLSTTVEVEHAVIRYTTDGSDPTYESAKYDSAHPITVNANMTLKAVVTKNRRILSEISEFSYRTYTKGPAGGYVFYDCDADNDETNGGAGPDGLKSDVCGWRYLEAAPADIAIGTKTTFTMAYFRNSDDGLNLYVTGTGMKTYVRGTADADDGRCTGTAVGTGKANTAKLVAAMGDNPYVSSSGDWRESDYAAKVCDEYECGGYDDWFLPSKDELTLMYTVLKCNSLGGFSNRTYWCSSEASETPCGGYAKDFACGLYYLQNRSYSECVRAIRCYR